MSTKYLNIPFSVEEKKIIKDLAYERSTTQTDIVLQIIRKALNQMHQPEIVEVEELLDIPKDYEITTYDSDNRTKSVKYEIPVSDLGFAISSQYRKDSQS